MTLQTRKPTGLPSWPVILLAGAEKSGKSYAAVQASASDLVGATYWIGVGEDDPDEYGQIPGADFEIVLHDGTYRGILNAVTDAVDAPRVDPAKPNLIVLDSFGRVWTLLSDQAQETANERARRRQKKVSDDGADITMDLWNTAKQRWNHILDELRRHDGPVIVTARLEEVAVVENGQPTKEKHWKVQAEKNLPFEVGMVIHLRAFGSYFLTGVRSLRFKPKPNEYTRLERLSLDELWRGLGMADEVGTRSHSGAEAKGQTAERDAILSEIATAAEACGISRQDVADRWAAEHNGEAIGQTSDLGSLELLRDDLLTREEASS